MALSATQRHPLMCITHDNLGLPHVEQARRLCGAGAQWIQLRMKHADPAAWFETASAVVEICRRHGALCIINDSIDVALAAGADGVHLGRKDGDWRAARALLGPARILGGTVNNRADARDAAAAGCLDYAGVGPWRFTTNKQNLAPILGANGVQELVHQLDGIPAWAIGGIEPSDMGGVRRSGAAGAAVSSALFRNDAVEQNFQSFTAAWGGGATSG